MSTEAELAVACERARVLKHRVITHRRKGERAPRLVKAYHRAKAGVAVLLRESRTAYGTKAVKWAKAQIGKTEHPPGSNTGPGISQWELSLTGSTGYPWCAAFCATALRVAGVPSSSLPPGLAYTPNIYEWARTGQFGYRRVSAPLPGDLVLFKWPGLSSDPCDHVGLYAGLGVTIEGNTSPGNNGSQANGGGVFARSRDRSLVAAYVRPPYPKVRL